MGVTEYRAAARGAAIALALSLWLVPNTFAAPSHPPLADPIVGYPVNHVCGTAVDSEGDLYVSNAGESKVEVFSSSGAHLTSIADGNEPCALAVDSSGNLYISNAETGEVVKRHPTTYPFTGIPSYEAPVTVDASGNAKGISVDPTDDSLYVAEGTRVAIYGSTDALFTDNEVQALVFPGSPTGGAYKLSFEGSETSAIPFNATSATVQAALESLPTIGVGNVTVAGNSTKVITFVGALASTDVPQVVVDASALVGSSAEIETRLDGFDGYLGEGEFTDATGVAAYTSRASNNFNKRRFVSVADAGSNEVDVFVGRLENLLGALLPGTLEARHAIDGSEAPAGELGLALGGAYLAVDSKNGHIFSYDATNKIVNEFEATGQYFTRIVDGEFADAEPTAIAVGRPGGADDGVIYVSAGASAGAKLLAFEPVVAPRRPLLEAPHSPRSFEFKGACGDAVDSEGDLYVAGESVIRIYSPAGNQLTSIPDPHNPCWLAVDSEGNLYAANLGAGGSGDEKVIRYEPDAYPFSTTPTYTEKGSIETLAEPRGVAIDPKNDRLFVTHNGAGIFEYKSAKEGSGLLKSNFCGLGGFTGGVDVYGANGAVYVISGNAINVCDASGAKVLATIDGSGSPAGPFSSLLEISIAVDQSNGDVLVGLMGTRGVVEEYEESGAFVAQYGPFSQVPGLFSDLALDNSGGPNEGNLYVAFDAPTGFDLTAFGPLNYGEAPTAVTGTADAIDSTGATLNGTIDPNDFEPEECTFEWGEAGNAFEHTEPCAETPAQIGHGVEPLPVHLDISGISPATTRYHFRLVAKNKFGVNEGEEALFGPPEATTRSAQPVSYTEATLRGGVDTSGLPTEYRFEYLTQAAYEANGETFAGAQSTPTQALPASSDGPDEVEVPLTHLAEGTVYRFRVLAENEAAKAQGLDNAFETLEREISSCPNATLRSGPSAALPDCRAYEMVSPADMGGLSPVWEPDGGVRFALAAPNGESAIFETEGSLPGTEGNGVLDAYRATRGPMGWTSSLFSPSGAQTSGNGNPGGASPDQEYFFWNFAGSTGSLDPTPPAARAAYIRRPGGVIDPACSPEPLGHFELIGCGRIGGGVVLDPEVRGRWIADGASHVIFSTQNTFNELAVQLESEAPPTGTEAIYDRTPDGVTHVVSLKPDGSSFGAGENASYLAANETGTAVAFKVGGALYLHRAGQTTEIAVAPYTFAGISADGKRVFFASTERGNEPAALLACAVEGGSCAGSGKAQEPTEIAPESIFVNVSADGSHVYFTSEELLDDAEEGVEGENNLYLWDAADESTRFVAILAPSDLVEFDGHNGISLERWTTGLDPDAGGTGSGPAVDPSRTTPGGRFFVFESHANLGEYDAEGKGEIYRYDAVGEDLTCVSCDPTGAPAGSDALLHPFEVIEAPIRGLSLIQNITDDGQEVFFQTADPLLPPDRNEAQDVYEWRARGSGEPPCKRDPGCLAMISSGQGSTNSFLYAMTPDGHDVFFTTRDALLPSDEEGGGYTLYDAHVDGGFPPSEGAGTCQGEACQPPSGAQPTLTAPASTSLHGEEAKSSTTCPKGSRKVRKAGKTHCVKPHKHHARNKKHRGKKGKSR